MFVHRFDRSGDARYKRRSRTSVQSRRSPEAQEWIAALDKNGVAKANRRHRGAQARQER